jgi:mannose-6-phosphate isomerase
MTQARQVYVFALAETRGWMTGARALALEGAHQMTKRYWRAGGAPGWAFSVARKGAVADGRRDFYAQAFALLALASVYKLDGSAHWLDLAGETLRFLDEKTARPSGGFAESWPQDTLPRRQNPHMHLLEALLALSQAAPQGHRLRDEALARAEALRALCAQRFVQSKGRVLVEFFDAELGALDGPDFPFEPGHHFEWIWLLDQHAALTGRDDSAALRQDLWRSARTRGVAEDGRIYAQARLEGPPDQATRLWTYAEAAKAALCMSSDTASAEADFFLENLRRRFLAPAAPGGWIDAYNAAGAPSVDYMPASSLYHIFCALEVYLTRRESKIERSGWR